jgi:hypothetical protein
MSADRRLAGLLETARLTLRRDLAPALPAEHRYSAAMVANAIAIAVRAMRDGPARGEQEAAAIRELYPDATGDLDELRARLATDIRNGALNGPADHAVRVVLRARVAARMAISVGA